MIQNLPYPSVQRVMEMTAFKDEATATAAIRTLKWLEKGAPHKVEGYHSLLEFDMTSYKMGLYEHNGDRCGTVCCIAGAIDTFRTNNWTPGAGIETVFNFNERNKDDPLTQLFFPRYETYNGVVGAVIRKTPEQAAETFREYLFTGKVNWR